MSIKPQQFADSASVFLVQSRCQQVKFDVYQTAAVCRQSVSIACTQSRCQQVKFDVYQTAAVLCVHRLVSVGTV